MKSLSSLILSALLLSFAYAQEVQPTDQPLVPAVQSQEKSNEAIKQDSAQKQEQSIDLEQRKQDEFQKAERLESLRYRHLWIAYALIWASVFWLMWKTWRKSVEQEEKIAELSQKIAQLDKK
jgi:hypothetical protein